MPPSAWIANGIRGFYLAISEFFYALVPEVVVRRKKQITDEELVVVYFHT